MNFVFAHYGERVRNFDPKYDEQVKLAFDSCETVIFHANQRNCLMRQQISVGPIKNIPAYHLFELLEIKPNELKPIIIAGYPERYEPKDWTVNYYRDLGYFDLALGPFQEMARILNRNIRVYISVSKGIESPYATTRPEEATDEYKIKYAGK